MHGPKLRLSAAILYVSSLERRVWVLYLHTWSTEIQCFSTKILSLLFFHPTSLCIILSLVAILPSDHLLVLE